MDSVLKPLNAGLGPNLKQLQRTGDGQTNPGGGIPAAQAMQGNVDASTAGGYKGADTPEKFSRFPAPLSDLIRRSIDGDPDPQGGRD